MAHDKRYLVLPSKKKKLGKSICYPYMFYISIWYTPNYSIPNGVFLNYYILIWYHLQQWYSLWPPGLTNDHPAAIATNPQLPSARPSRLLIGDSGRKYGGKLAALQMAAKTKVLRVNYCEIPWRIHNILLLRTS